MATIDYGGWEKPANADQRRAWEHIEDVASRYPDEWRFIYGPASQPPRSAFTVTIEIAGKQVASMPFDCGYGPFSNVASWLNDELPRIRRARERT